MAEETTTENVEKTGDFCDSCGARHPLHRAPGGAWGSRHKKSRYRIFKNSVVAVDPPEWLDKGDDDRDICGRCAVRLFTQLSTAIMESADRTAHIMEAAAGLKKLIDLQVIHVDREGQ